MWVVKAPASLSESGEMRKQRRHCFYSRRSAWRIMGNVTDEASDPIQEVVDAASNRLLDVIAVVLDELSVEVERFRAMLDLLEGEAEGSSDDRDAWRDRADGTRRRGPAT